MAGPTPGGSSWCMLWLCLLALVLPSLALGQRVGLLVEPAEADVSGAEHWADTIAFAEAAAEDLGVELVVAYAGGTKAGALAQLHQLAGRDKPVDGLLLYDVGGVSEHVAVICQANKVPYLYVGAPPRNEVIAATTTEDRLCVGVVMPDRAAATVEAAETLRAACKELDRAEGSVTICGIGPSAGHPGLDEVRAALRDWSAADENLSVPQVVYSDGSEGDAYRITKGLLARYPEMNGLWLGRALPVDAMARAATEAERTLGRDLLVSGTQWTADNERALQDGTMLACIGGEQFAAGFALVVMADMLSALEGARSAVNVRYPMYVVTRDKLEEQRSLWDGSSWRSIEFGAFRTSNPNGEPDYTFRLLPIRAAASP